MKKNKWRNIIPSSYEEKKDICSAFEPIITRLLTTAKSDNVPCLVHMLGIPGAGKTTFLNKNKAAFSDYLLVSFDEIMECLPAYREDVRSLGPKEAFSRWEIPARIAGYELLIRALEQKKSIFFDHGGSPELHLTLMEEAKKAGYHTKMYYIKCDINTALKRVKSREKAICRHTPSELVKSRHPLVEQRAEQFKRIVDEFIEV